VRPEAGDATEPTISKPRKPRPSTRPQTFALVVEMGEGKHRHSYRVSPVPVAEGSGVARLYRFRRLDGDATYWVARHDDGSMSCDCADATYRDATCKHQRVAVRLGAIFG
jgi:hypothetical protein